jgi:NDP-sugar pyrophosphorylase family protein
MAGGKGLRLRPLTENTPKPLLKVGESTILDKVLEGLESSGVADVVISVNYLGDKIKEHVSASKRDGLNVGFVEEGRELGTAGSLSLLEPRPAGSFIVMNADLITQVDFNALQRFHSKEGNKLSVCVRKIKDSIPYGVISLADGSRSISRVEEKPEREYLVNAGIYMLEPEILDLIPKDRFFDMVSLINLALESGLKVGAFPIFEYWRDIGRHQEMKAAISDLEGGLSTANRTTTVQPGGTTP